MKKAVLILFLGLFMSVPSYAQSMKFITLTDGSVVKGTVVELSDGVYTIETAHLGEITIDESQIVSISNMPATPAQVPGTLPMGGSGMTGEANKAALMNQVQALQGNVMSNPAMMADIQSLLQDPNIVNILKDQNFVNDIMSYDPNRIQNNDKAQELLKNPQIRAMMEKISDQNSR